MPRARPAESTLALERFLPYRLSVLSNRLSRSIAAVYARRFRLTIPEWRVMAVLGRFGPMSAIGVCERTAMDKVRVSRAVARLIASGRVARSVDSADRRRSVLDLTAKGRAVYGEIVPLALAAEARLISTLSPTERSTLDRLMARLEAAAENFAIETAD